MSCFKIANIFTFFCLVKYLNRAILLALNLIVNKVNEVTDKAFDSFCDTTYLGFDPLLKAFLLTNRYFYMLTNTCSNNSKFFFARGWFLKFFLFEFSLLELFFF